MGTKATTAWRKRRVVVLTVVLAAGSALAWHLANHVSLETLIVREQRLREAIAQRPWSSFTIGFAIYSIASLVPGTSGKSAVFAWLYGFWQGVALIILGLCTAAMAAFYLSRYVWRDWIERRYAALLATLNKHLDREGAFYLLTLRMAHFPYFILNLAAGASRMRARTFLWATALGMLPGSMVFAYVGCRLPSLEELERSGLGSLIDPFLIAALTVTATFPFLVRWAARRLGITGGSGGDPHLPDGPQPELPEP